MGNKLTYTEQMKNDFQNGRGNWVLKDDNTFTKKPKESSVFDADFEYTAGEALSPTPIDELNLVLGFTSIFKKALPVDNYEEFKGYLENTLHNLDLLTDNMELFLNTPKLLFKEDSPYRDKFIFNHMNHGFKPIGVLVYDHLNISQSLDLIGYTGESIVFLSISHSDKQVPVVFNAKIEDVEDSIVIHNYNDKTETIIHTNKELFEYLNNLNLVSIPDKESDELQKEVRKLTEKNNLEEVFKEFNEDLYNQTFSK